MLQLIVPISAKIQELENELSEAQDDLTSLQERLNDEVTDLSARTRHEIDTGRDEMNAKLLTLTKENETLKAEVKLYTYNTYLPVKHKGFILHY